MPQVSKLLILSCFLMLLKHNAYGAMKKSWKPAANFDADIPKFTPFDQEGPNDEPQNNEEYLPQPFADDPAPTQETYHESPSPSSSTPESLVEEASSVKTPFRSKVKIGSKVPEAYNHQKHHFNKNSNNNNFGSFNAEMKPESENIQPEPVQQDSTDNSEPAVIDSLIDEFIAANEDVVDINKQSDDNEATVEDEESDNNVHQGKKRPEESKVTEYNLGQVMNLTVNEKDSSVSVKFDENSLKEIMTGRGKKYGMMERVLPLFILPFLIQSAVVPFIVTTIKLFLLKSVFAGKIAILLLLLGALKSHQNSLYMKSLHSPYYLKDFAPVLPERRFSGESNYDGYRAEGRPTAYVN